MKRLLFLSIISVLMVSCAASRVYVAKSITDVRGCEKVGDFTPTLKDKVKIEISKYIGTDILEEKAFEFKANAVLKYKNTYVFYHCEDLQL